MRYEQQAGATRKTEYNQDEEHSNSYNENRFRKLIGRSLAAVALATSVALLGDVSSREVQGSANTKQVYNSSLNWAGYDVATPAAMNFLTEDFIVPSVTCPPTGETDVSIWGGVGTGSGSDDLYQTGIRLECNNGTESSHVWWEDYPNNSEQDYSGRTVSAGDKILVQVLPFDTPGHKVRLDISDYGSNLSNSSPMWLSEEVITLTAAPSASTSECIVERPTIGGSFAELAEFSTIEFSTAASNSPAVACDVVASAKDHIVSSSTGILNHGLTGSPIDMENSSSTLLADTSGLSASGVFDVNWDAGS